MRAVLLAACAAFVLAGCQSAEEKRAAETGEIEATNATMAQVNSLIKAARAKSKLQPGQWQTELRVLGADLSGVPAGAARDTQLAAIKGQERASTGCRTADDLKPLDLDNLEKIAGTCTFPHYIQKGGTLDAEIACGEGAAKAVVIAKGAFTPTGYDITIDQTSGTAGAAGYLALKLHAKGSRTGNCVPKAAG